MTPELTTKPSRQFRIVVALDESEYAEIVLEHALDQAARHTAPDLHFITVVDGAHADLDAIKRRLAMLVLPAVANIDCTAWQARLHVRSGRAHEEIVNLAAEIRAHLIVVGRFGLHHPSGRLGSVASRVLDSASCPTLVVGVVDEAPEATAQCADCVAVRAESDGERWFCDAHRSPDRVSMTSLIPSSTLTGGGLMW